eukprot:g31611.t1
MRNIRDGEKHQTEDGGMYDIIKYPLLTEKACRLLENYNIYTFLVDRRANKPQIRAAIETIFDVKVVKCNTLIPNSRYTLAFGQKIGRKSLFKKAYVQLEDVHVDRCLPATALPSLISSTAVNAGMQVQG